MECDERYEKRMQEEDFGDSDTGRIRKYLWNLTEYPETSLAARVFNIPFFFKKTFFLNFQMFAFLSMSVVIISTITFLLSTLPQLATNLDLILFENKSGGKTDMPVERWEKVSSSKISCLERKMPQSEVGSMQGSTDSCLPPKAVVHRRSSSTEGCLPPKVVFQ